MTSIRHEQVEPSMSGEVITRLFVYGTLQPGDVRWHHLEPFVVDDGVADTVTGRVFDTGLDYPAAIFGDHAAPGGTIVGRTYTLDEASLADALAHLDEVEDTVGGRYHRVSVITGTGTTAWAYEYGGGLDLVEIVSGNWFDR
ncbi:hypothetical protein YM304_36510 [Ilumatobacter coccineus YM16-304]|uniref:Gamma-glutamylcyclotransferase AIG2-like domain-containing protein n=2 Tax=Ilumatobacter coccineus TaxID=467094 RepID=A0A6C7EG48_ILUCY|nr:hypothetical protein YM304_36510 [Ilumatobacter coccineus YM16-304]